MFGLLAGLSHAEIQVLIVAGDGGAAQTSAIASLTSELTKTGSPPETLAIWDLAEWRDKRTAASPRVVIALGTAATSLLAESLPKAPVLAALLPRQNFDRILRQSGRKVSKQFTAIYLDQPLTRQVALVRAALPQARKIGVLWGPESKANALALRSLVDASGMQLLEAELTADITVSPDLRKVLAGSDVFLAMADPQVFNSNSIQNLLLATFRANVPMLAFSPAYVRAGAWLSLHVTPQQIGQQAAYWAHAVLQGGSLPEVALDSSDFEVTVNEHVGRSLNLKADGPQLRLQLRHLEQLP